MKDEKMKLQKSTKKQQERKEKDVLLDETKTGVDELTFIQKMKNFLMNFMSKK
jgi:hypothetical protein